MKIYISADIEGATGITDWAEADKRSPDYQYYAEQMTREVAAACRAALESKATEIVVRDAHGSARNMNPREFPPGVSFIRGWSGGPLNMMDGIDESFDACFLLCYHNAATSPHNPLSHSFSSSKVYQLRLNGEVASEYLINSYTAYYYGVPLLFLSGDAELCADAKHRVPGLETVASLQGIGAATHSRHPDETIQLIGAGVKRALSRELPAAPLLPDKFVLEITYLNHKIAYTNAFYPGAELVNSTTVRFVADDWYEVLRCLNFII